MKILASIVILVLVSGCVGGLSIASGKLQTDPEFNVILLEDVQQSLLMAKRANDQLAIKCWTYIETLSLLRDLYWRTEEGVEPGKVVGPLSAYQKARNVRRLVVEVKISDAFRLECGPMLTESMGVFGKLGIRLAL